MTPTLNPVSVGHLLHLRFFGLGRAYRKIVARSRLQMGGLKASEMYEAGRSPVPLNDLLGSRGDLATNTVCKYRIFSDFWHEFGSFCLNSLCLFA